MLFVSHCIYSHILLLVYLSQTKQCGLFEGFIIHFTAFKAWSKRFDHFTLPHTNTRVIIKYMERSTKKSADSNFL